MYVRWKKRALPAIPYAANYTRNDPPQPEGERAGWYAILVESRRVDGKPRQRVIAHLGGIHREDLDNPREQYYFWRQVHKRLLGLNIPADVRDRIDETLIKTVPYPSRESIQECVNGRWLEQDALLWPGPLPSTTRLAEV